MKTSQESTELEKRLVRADWILKKDEDQKNLSLQNHFFFLFNFIL